MAGHSPHPEGMAAAADPARLRHEEQASARAGPAEGHAERWVAQGSQLAARLVGTDGATRARVVAHLQRTHGNAYVQRVAASLHRAPSEPAAGQRLLQREISFDECSASQEAEVTAAHDRARAMMRNAIRKLRRYDGTNPAEVHAALSRHFHSPPRFAWTVKENLLNIRRQMGDTQYECADSTPGRGWSPWCVPFSDIELRADWFADTDIDARARTIIHESFHRYGCKLDLGYEWSEDYGSHGTLRALLNADAFAHFVIDVR